MQEKKKTRNISFKFRFGGSVGLTSAESVVVRTLDNMKRANAYVIWQKSGLKHYPTVLRALKNLQSKGLVDVIKSGIGRGDRLFTLAVKGETLLLSQQEAPVIISALSNKSTRFRSLAQSEVEDAQKLASGILDEIIVMILKETGKRIDIDDIVETCVYNYADEWLTEIKNCLGTLREENDKQISQIVDEMKRLGKIGWVRDLILEAAKNLYNWDRKSADIYKDLIDDLKS